MEDEKESIAKSLRAAGVKRKSRISLTKAQELMLGSMVHECGGARAGRNHFYCKTGIDASEAMAYKCRQI